MAQLQIPTPSPLPSPSNSPYSLSERINIATRPVHSQLNKLIIARLPLALPPHTPNPSTYISGLLHIAPIYITFETAWQSILDTARTPPIIRRSHTLDECDPDDDTLPSTHTPPVTHTPNACSRTNSVLSHLRLPGLLRAGRLRADIRVLTGTPEHRIDEQIQAVSQNGALAAFIKHTKRSVAHNPLVLLAYAWVMYMALFSGGRYLRALLQEAGGKGHEFWDREPSPVRPYAVTGGPKSVLKKDSKKRRGGSKSAREPDLAWGKPARPRSRSLRSKSVASEPIAGMEFFNFLGEEDGEDLKREFKKRIVESELLLTEGEKEDIINEANVIFTSMIALVEELDNVMGKNQYDGSCDEPPEPHLLRPALSTPDRDSFSVTQERLSKKVRTPSDVLEEEGVDPLVLNASLSSPAKLVGREITSCFREKSPSGRSSPNRVTFSPLPSPHPEDGPYTSPLMSGTTLLPILALLIFWVLWYFM